MRTVGRARGFALVEAGVVLLTLVLIASILLVSGRRSRGNAQQAGSMANLHEFAAVTASYQADYSDQFWALSWGLSNRGTSISQFADINGALNASADAMRTAAAQAIDIARRRGAPEVPLSLVSGNWFPHPVANHWVLSDYLEQPLTLRFAVSPGDVNRMKWSNDPQGFFANTYYQNGWPDCSDPMNRRYAFSTSYRSGLAFYSMDYYLATGAGAQPIATIIHGSATHVFGWTPGQRPDRLGGRRSVEVAYPSHKVHLFDAAQWNGARRAINWIEERAQLPMLFVDGSARVRVTGQANMGFNPGSPTFQFGYQVGYEPQKWEAPGPAGNYYARYSFTRGGLKGRDYDGTEAVGPPY